MPPGDARRRALSALRDRDVASAAATLALAREELARLEDELERRAGAREGFVRREVPAVLLEIECSGEDRRRAERARLAERRTAALAHVERCQDALARALRARSAGA